MRLLKAVDLLLVAIMLAFSNAAYTSVYELDNLLTASQGYLSTDPVQSETFAQLAAQDISLSIPTFAPRIKHRLFSRISDEVFMGSINFDLTPDYVSHPVNYFIGSYQTGAQSVSGTSVLDDFNFSTQFKRGDRHRSHDKYPPVTTPVPEPESYAMILAGLGLILFTARRRKQNINLD